MKQKNNALAALPPAGLETVTITGIHGSDRQIEAKLTNNTLILVGENGSGKTTFLRVLFCVLAGRWISLLQTPFHAAVLRLNGEDIEVRYSDIRDSLEPLDQRVLRELPLGARRSLQGAIERGEASDPAFLESFSEHFGIPMRYLLDQLHFIDDRIQHPNKKTREALTRIRTHLDAQILYLPTYRRIERELASIFEGISTDDPKRHRGAQTKQETSPYYVELVQFGMRDVVEAVESTLKDLREVQRKNLNDLTLKHLGDIVNREYQSADTHELEQVSESAIDSALARMDETILPPEERQDWGNAIREARSAAQPTDHDKIIRHYFLKILKFQESLQALEQNIDKFCSLCNAYITEKRFVYDSSTFTFLIVPDDRTRIQSPLKLSDLSSGEKQVVSLFSHLYLSGHKRYFVLIDEPELSLSVPWQKRFLVDVRNGSFCSGLVAVTHSPFIYENELKQYAHSLGEFS